MKSNNDENNPVDISAQLMKKAWDEMLVQLEQARDSIDSPELFAPPASDRNLAEGYRYLMGYLHGAIDRAFADPDFPAFRRAIQPIDRATIDNADALYLCAEFNGEESYLITGRCQDFRHWHGDTPLPGGPKAPQYVIFEAASDYAGDSGSIAELIPGTRVNTSTLDSSKIQLDEMGNFEILLAPTCPEGYQGNYMASTKTYEKKEADGSVLKTHYVGRYLTVRELFHDWENEQALDLYISKTAGEGNFPPVLSSEIAAAQIQRVGNIVNHQMRFWNEFYAVVLETYQDMNGDGKQFMPRNDLNQPNALGIATGGGQSTNVYSGGVYELEEDEVLIVEARIPIPPAYTGFHLANLWGESLDFANHTSSLNGYQVKVDSDGAIRWVIAHRDPAVANWLDTTGIPMGFMALRFTYSEKPDSYPELKVKKVPFDQLSENLPEDTASVNAEERKRQIQIRQRHVQRRYRQY